MPYLWAAYRMGAFPEIEENLNTQEFEQIVLQFEDLGFTTLVFVADKPVGLGMSRIFDHPNNIVNPHLVWFPWATSRNKIQAAIEYCLLAKKEEIKFLAYTKPEAASFFNHICKYGVLRRFGTYRGFFEDGTDAAMYQTVKDK